MEGCIKVNTVWIHNYCNYRSENVKVKTHPKMNVTVLTFNLISTLI